MTLAIDEAVLVAPPCGQHAANASVARCVRCERPLCHVCVFTFGSATYCPDCLIAGPSREETSGVLSKGVLSILLAVFGAGITAVFFVGGAQRFGKEVATVLSYPWIASTIGGAALALIARDGARRRGSVLPTVGLVANGILIVIQLVLTIIGFFTGK
jgi:hypothetical protein